MSMNQHSLKSAHISTLMSQNTISVLICLQSYADFNLFGAKVTPLETP